MGQNSIPEQVETYLRGFAPKELRIVRVHHVADALNLHKRMLQLILQESGTKFQTIKDKLIWKAFEDMIKNPELSIKEISRKLGYASQTILSRRCQKRYGMSPTQMRAKVLEKKKKTH